MGRAAPYLMITAGVVLMVLGALLAYLVLIVSLMFTSAGPGVRLVPPALLVLVGAGLVGVGLREARRAGHR